MIIHAADRVPLSGQIYAGFGLALVVGMVVVAVAMWALTPRDRAIRHEAAAEDEVPVQKAAVTVVDRTRRPGDDDEGTAFL